MPRRLEGRAILALTAVINDASLRVVLPQLQQVVTDLDAVQTGDPALRAGRRAWRANVREVAEMPTVKTPCRAFRRWKRSGWRESAAPFSRADARKARALDKNTRRGFTRAVRRLRALDMSRRRAAGFTGDRVLGPVLRAVARELDVD